MVLELTDLGYPEFSVWSFPEVSEWAASFSDYGENPRGGLALKDEDLLCISPHLIPCRATYYITIIVESILLGGRGRHQGRDGWGASPPVLLISHVINARWCGLPSHFTQCSLDGTGVQNPTHSNIMVFKKAFPPIFLSGVSAVSPHAESWHFKEDAPSSPLQLEQEASQQPVPWGQLEDFSMHILSGHQLKVSCHIKVPYPLNILRKENNLLVAHGD